MGREVVVGIVVSAKDAATAVLRGTGEAAKGVDGAISALAKSGSEGFHTMHTALRFFHVALEPARLAMDAFKRTIGDSVEKALEWRGKADPAAKAIHDFGNAFNTTRARIGDQFIPIIRGAIDVMTPLLAQTNKWIHANSELVSSTIIDWSVKLASVLVSGVAWGILQVIRVYYGWKIAVVAVEAIWGEAVAGILAGIDYILSGWQQLLSVVGKDDWAKKIDEGRKILQGIGKESERVSDEALAQAAAEIRALDAKEKSLDKLKDKIKEVIVKTGIAAYKHLAEAASQSSTRSAEEEEAYTSRVLANYAFKAEANKAYNDALAAVNEAEFNREREIEQKKMQEIQQLNDGTIAGLLKSWAAYEQQKKTLGKEAIAELDRAFDREFKSHTKEIAGEIKSIFSETISGITDTFKQAFTGLNDMEDVSVKKFAIKAEVYNKQTKQMMEVTTDVVDKMTNAQVIALAKQGKKAEEITVTMRQNTKTLAQAIGQAFAGIGQTILETAEKFVISKGIEMAANKAAALFSIQASAAEAGGKSGASAAGELPFPANLALMAAAIAAASAMVLKLAGVFHAGGLIPGPEGQERMIRAQSGEVVLPIPVVRAIRSGGAMPASVDQRASVASGSSRHDDTSSATSHGAPSVTIVQQLLGTQDKTAIRRNLNDSLLPVIREWLRTGALRLPPGR